MKTEKKIISRKELPNYDARRREFVSQVAAALEAKGHVLSPTTNGVNSVDGYFVSFDVRVSCPLAVTPTSRMADVVDLRYSVGPYGDRTNYPEPKNGFDIDKAVDRIEQCIAIAKRAADDRKAKEIREQAAKAALAEACVVLGFATPSEYREEQAGKVGRFNTVAKRTMTGNVVNLSIRVNIDDLAKVKAALQAL